MKDKEYLNCDLAVIAKEKGFNEECNFKYIQDAFDESKQNIVSRSSAIPTLCKAPTYHQLIDWLFIDGMSVTSKEANIEWLKEWYEHLKDCPLNGEFIYRLKEWFRINDILIIIDKEQSNLWCYYIGSIENSVCLHTQDVFKVYEEAEHAAIIKTFEILKK